MADKVLAEKWDLRFILFRQGPWNADLQTPPGPEGSNGSLLRIRRGHPGIFNSERDSIRRVQLAASMRTFRPAE